MTRTFLAGTGLVATAALLLTGCKEAGNARPAHKTPVPLPSPTGTKQQISIKNLGYLWPFTVDHGTIECRPPVRAVFVTPEGKAYALNGRAEKAGYAKVTPIRAEGDGGAHISLGAIRGEALKLCGKD